MQDHEGDVGRLAQALEAAGAVVRRIGDDRWTAPTPCPEWTVRGLVDHLAGGNQLFARVLRGESFESAAAAVRDPATDRLGDDPVAAYDASVRDVVGAFSAPGALERVVRVLFGTVPGASRSGPARRRSTGSSPCSGARSRVPEAPARAGRGAHLITPSRG